MKARTFLKSSISIAALSLVTPAALANLAIPQVEIHTYLVHEDVHCEIKGDEAIVTGTFTYESKHLDYLDLNLYLPVYAKQGTPVEQMKPEIKMHGKALEVKFIKKQWESHSDITSFGKLPQLEGQRVYWFLAPHIPQLPVTNAEDKPQKLLAQIRYTQKLSNGKFIYTPLIPKQKKGVDYGSITVSADRPLKLQNSESHDFIEKDGKFVIEPSDKRGIVVEVATAKPSIP